MASELRFASQFKIYSGLLKAYTSPDGKKRFTTTASSTVKDLQGDEILQSAIDKMAATAPGMTIFLNHEYRVPEDVMGSVDTARAIARGYDGETPIVDLDFDIAVNETNPRAVQAWAAIESGVKLGTSIGAQIPEGGAKRNKNGTLVVSDVNLLEASVVGIPANPRSWVHYAMKSLAPMADLETKAERGVEDEISSEPLIEAAEEPEVVKSEELDQTVETDLAEGRTKVTVTVTSDDSTGSQDASSPSSPENEALLDETADGDTAALGDTVTRDVPEDTIVDFGMEGLALSSVVMRLTEAVSRIETLTKQVDELTSERDDLAENFAAAKEIIERVANLPIGRKTAFAGAVTDFRARFPMYDEDFVRFLEK
jgi:phage head maturation protease